MPCKVGLAIPAGSTRIIIRGKGRLASYEAPTSGNTVDFQAGDVGYVPVTNAHYLENIGTEDLVYIGNVIPRDSTHTPSARC